jgi:uncharacterized protein
MTKTLAGHKPGDLVTFEYIRKPNQSSMKKHTVIEQEQFLYYVIKEKAEIYTALKTFFRTREAVG